VSRTEGIALQWVQQQSRAWLSGVVEMMRRMVDAAPSQPKGWEKLGTTLLLAGDAAASVATLREACGRFPEHTAMYLQLARSTMALGQYEAALDATEAVLRLDPDSSAALNLRFSLLVKIGRPEQAESLLPQYVAAGGASVSLFHFAVGRARARNDWQPLLDLCDGILAHSPGNTGARYYRALALIRLGRPTEADLNPAEFLSRTALPPPEGRSMEAFLDDVRREILANPTLAPDPRGFTTTHGMQTRELLQPEDTAVPALCRQIQAAVDRYEQQLIASGRTDPFIAGRPPRVSLSPWAVVYPGEGKQRSHIHAPGWLSGVYYVAAPPGGELFLGAMDEDDTTEIPWKVETIQPEANLLVLFPSFIPHATEATHSDDLRICVAFDVVPE
jgi:tetratricopeptide (TPR) repeat protein